MKRCPSCNQTFDEPWLSFCTQDGTSLIEDTGASREPPPTMVSPPMPPSVSPMEQRPLDLPGSYNPPARLTQPQPPAATWQPPPPPAYSVAPQQGLALTSLILGIFSITIGWCCSLGVLTAPVGIVLGIVSLVQIKNDPSKHTGKPLAIIGIITGAAYLLFWALLVLMYGLAIFMGNLK